MPEKHFCQIKISPGIGEKCLPVFILFIGDSRCKNNILCRKRNREEIDIGLIPKIEIILVPKD